MKTFFVWLILLIYPVFPQYLPGAKHYALASADIALSKSPFAVFTNPAGLNQLTNTEIGIYHSPAPFGLTELSNTFIAVQHPFDFGSLGFGIKSYGFELYRETGFTLAYSNNFFDNIYTGVSIEMQRVTIQNYGSDNAFMINVGGVYFLSEEFSTGFSLMNLNRATIGNEKSQRAVTMKMGLGYYPIKNLQLFAAIEKESDRNSTLCYGISFSPINEISLRTGISNVPKRFTAGIGLNYSFFEIEYAMGYHQILGYSHQFGIVISIDKTAIF